VFREVLNGILLFFLHSCGEGISAAHVSSFADVDSMSFMSRREKSAFSWYAALHDENPNRNLFASLTPVFRSSPSSHPPPRGFDRLEVDRIFSLRVTHSLLSSVFDQLNSSPPLKIDCAIKLSGIGIRHQPYKPHTINHLAKSLTPRYVNIAAKYLSSGPSVQPCLSTASNLVLALVGWEEAVA
jgi:hypothetical protein